MLYAAYGSNLHPLRLRERISSAKLIETSLVPGWSLQFHKRSRDLSGKCNIVSGGSGVHLAIYDISVADKNALDKIEGLGAGYIETSFSVEGFGECMSYVAEDSYIDDGLVPYDWYKELVLVGARAHCFPLAYIDYIAKVSACQDPDLQRRASSWRTIELAKDYVLR